MDLDKILFEGKSFSGLLKDIYQNHKTKDKQITSLINELRPLIKDIGDATLLVPLIKEYLEIGNKVDDQLVKLAAIVQKLVENEGGEVGGISEKEKEELLQAIAEEKKKDDNQTGDK